MGAGEKNVVAPLRLIGEGFSEAPFSMVRGIVLGALRCVDF